VLGSARLSRRSSICLLCCSLNKQKRPVAFCDRLELLLLKRCRNRNVFNQNYEHMCVCVCACACACVCVGVLIQLLSCLGLIREQVQILSLCVRVHACTLHTGTHMEGNVYRTLVGLMDTKVRRWHSASSTCWSASSSRRSSAYMLRCLLNKQNRPIAFCDRWHKSAM